MKPVVFGLAVCLLASGPLCELARGDLLALQFAGVIESVYDPQGALTGRVQTGAPFSGQFLYDPTVPDAWSDPVLGHYESADFGILVTVGTVVLDSRGGASSFVDVGNRSADELTLGSTNFKSAGLHLIGGQVYLADSTGATLSSDSLPILGQDLSRCGRRAFGAKGWGAGGEYFEFSGNLTSASIVPDPGTLALFAAGTALAFSRRKGIGRSPNPNEFANEYGVPAGPIPARICANSQEVM